MKNVIKILNIVFAVLIVAFGIFMAVYFITAGKKLKEVTLVADFAEDEISVNGEYTFTIKTVPEKASIKKAKLKCDDPNATFELNEKTGKAVLRTGASETAVSVCVEVKDIKSNVLSYPVVDFVARKALEEAEAEAAAAEAEAAAAEAAAAEAEAEAALVQKAYVKMTGDNVNVRSQNNTNCDVLGKAKKGEMFEKIETVDDWTHITYKGQDGYIKSEYLTEISEDEFNAGAGNTTASTENKEEKKEEPKQEEKKQDTAANAEAAAAAAAAQAAEDAAKAQAEALAAQQAAAAAAAAMGTPIHCKDGTCYVTPAQLQKIHATWDFAGDAIEMAGHHSIGELEAVVGPTQH